MKKNIKGNVYQTWKAIDGSFSGYSVAMVYYQFNASKDGFDVECGNERNTLKAAINDGKRFFKKNGVGYRIEVNAHADLYDYFDNGAQRGDLKEDTCFLGLIDENGEYFKMYNSAEWL